MVQTVDELSAARVLYYPLKGDARNYAREGLDGEPAPNVTFVPGRWGNAADFTKPGAHINVRGLDRYTQAYTYSAWVKIRSLQGIDRGGGNYGTIFGPLKLNRTTGQLMFHFDYDDFGRHERVRIPFESAGVLPPNQWHHVLVTYEHAARRLVFCIDGRVDKICSLSDKVAPTDKPRLCVHTIGGWIREGCATYDSALNGWVSDAALFEVAAKGEGLNVLSGLRTYPSLECAEACLGVHVGGDRQKRVAFVALAIPVALAVFGIMAAQYWVTEVAQQTTDRPDISLDEIARRIRQYVGEPARLDRFVRRQDVGIGNDRRVHLDIGGEGYHEVHGVRSGFVEAINVNAQAHDSQPPYGPIPNLVNVRPWAENPPYPFADGFADFVTMQGAPLTPKGVTEMARVLRHGGEIGLWIDPVHYRQPIDELARLLNTKATYNAYDEFHGAAGYPKTQIVCRRRKEDL